MARPGGGLGGPSSLLAQSARGLGPGGALARSATLKSNSAQRKPAQEEADDEPIEPFDPSRQIGIVRVRCVQKYFFKK